MTAKPELVRTEVDPRTHQGLLAFLRDWFVTEARQTFSRPEPVALPIPKHAVSMGAPALSTHDLQDSGVEWALNELAGPQTIPALDAIVRDVCARLKRKFLVIERHRQEDVARIRNLESLVQEKDAQIDALRRLVSQNVQRLDEIVKHNDRIANLTTALVLASDPLLNLAKAAPALLKLVEG